MATDVEPTERLVLQRLRNRVMESLETLADGEAGVEAVGAAEYFDVFFDVIDDSAPWAWRTWSCWTQSEVQALDAVLHIAVEACEATPGIMSDDGLVASGWPLLITPLAGRALALMRIRGRFREDAEENEPSLPA